MIRGIGWVIFDLVSGREPTDSQAKAAGCLVVFCMLAVGGIIGIIVLLEILQLFVGGGVPVEFDD